jgi:membrane protein
MIKKLKHFFSTELWNSTDEAYNKPQKILIQTVRILSLSFRGFKEDEVLLRSSALTFYTLISIVPIIAMAFGLATGFGQDEAFVAQIQEYFSTQPEISEKLIEFSHSSLENTKGGLIAGFGLVLLFWSVMKVLGNIELSFNAVWGIKTPRTIIKKLTEYIAIMLIGPILMIASSAVTIFISSAATHVLSDDNSFYMLGSVFKILIELIPYLLIWTLFTFIYMAIPNAKVKFKYAVVAGIIAGSCFNFLEWAYFAFQFGAVKSNAIYGSFAAVPLFLVWVQGSWIIVLFGCEIAFSGQNVDRYMYEKEVNSISIAHKRKIGLVILLHLNRKFNKGRKPLNITQLCEITQLPIRLVRTILDQLIDAKLIAESLDEKDDATYLPARDLNSMKYSEMIEVIDDAGSSAVPINNQLEWEVLNKIIVDLRLKSLKDPMNKTWNEIEKELDLK